MTNISKTNQTFKIVLKKMINMNTRLPTSIVTLK